MSIAFSLFCGVVGWLVFSINTEVNQLCNVTLRQT